MISSVTAFSFTYNNLFPVYNPFTTKQDYIHTGNYSGNNLTADNIFGNLSGYVSYTNLTDIPMACSTYSAVTDLNYPTTCTSYEYMSTLNVTGNVTIGNDITADNLFGNVTGAIINTNAPTQCPSNTGMVYYNGSNSVCTQSIGYWNLSGTNMFPDLLSNNVGIGTDSPSNKLVVNGNFSITNGDYLVSNDKCAFKSVADPDICLLFKAVSPSSYVFLDGSADAIMSVVVGTKTVGIGKVNPSARLEVNGTSRFGDGGSNYMSTDIDGDLLFVGTSNYLVSLGQAAFKAQVAETAGLWFMGTPGRYAFTDTGGDEIFTIAATNGATDGDTVIEGELKSAGIYSDGSGKAVCIKSDGNLGTCTDAVGASGTCTCT